MAPLSEAVPHAATESVSPTSATPMVAHRPRTAGTGPGTQPASNAYIEVDAMRPTSPQLPADPTPVPLVTERMGARIAAGEGSLAFHRASGTWIAGSRRSGDKPRPPVRSGDPYGVDRQAVSVKLKVTMVKEWFTLRGVYVFFSQARVDDSGLLDRRVQPSATNGHQ